MRGTESTREDGLRQYLLERERDENQSDAQGHRDRLRRVMSRLSRLNDSSTSQSATTSAAYGDRVPSQNSLYDWSPAIEHDPEDDEELDTILQELRREQPNTHPEILRVLGRLQLDSERERIRSISSRLNQDRTGAGGESLRSTAILQNVRRHPRFSARSREYLQRYNTDSDQTSRPSQHSDSHTRHMRQLTMRHEDNRRRDMLSRADSYRRSYLDHRSSTSTPPVSPMLEQTVKYLSKIRHSNTIDDSLNHALDAGFLAKDYLCIQYADFITNTAVIPPPVETSWLTPGAVLSGCQHATSVTSAAAADPSGWNDLNRRAALAGLPSLAPPTRPWLANSYSTPRSRTSQLTTDPTASQPAPQDRWPVRVTIHEVDWQSMSLSATMEAYNVPSHPHSHQSILSASESSQQQYTRTSSITTYLEGEILDFNTHTLLTESFKSSAANDATYWRKLPPFEHMSDEEVVRALTDKKWFGEVLNKEYVLMRWKERCFVKSLPATEGINTPSGMGATPVQPPSQPSWTQDQRASDVPPYRLTRSPTSHQLRVEVYSPSNPNHTQPSAYQPDPSSTHASFINPFNPESSCGLTISGFYYVCLRRKDGVLDGLYYDPQSSPYQCLRLESRMGGVRGAWGFV